MNENPGHKLQTTVAPPALPAGEEDRRVLRLERTALRVDPPIVRFAVRSD